ncbi:diguanylate cyclase [Anaerobaca lacustris]|uniref:Diguanylate cyclase n=1 Tax=Anaerobaca lacustris TaxID=3044600 RepID=A0AAW6TYS2_9BACT|nr:diguanylate cyclase [Sedimentisphaerales bacterium M17dextr]
MLESGDCPAGIVTIGRNDSIKQAAAKMLTHNVGCLIVNDENGKYIGLVTERDIAHFIADASEDRNSARVDRIMTDQIISCAPGTPASQVRKIMAAHRIRHLPLIENGVVTGILSARDIMGQQLIEDRAAAEEVAMLSNCLKSIDLNEAVEIAAAEVPKLFGAGNCILCLYRDGRQDGAPELLSSNRCPCLGGHMDEAEAIAQQSTEDGYCTDEISPECESCGGKPPRVVIPLEVVGLREAGIGKEKRLSGYLCMCDLDPAVASDRELISYKAKLTREILTAHLTNATRYQQARLSSLTDALTGVGSRKLLEDKLQAECARAERYKRPFSVAIIDFDHFKMINDVLGHATGDEAIRRLAACMKAEKRVPDVLARYGGDEFVILMPETKATDAKVLLERVRAKAQTIRLPQDTSVSISCGVAECDLEHNDPRDVMRRADLALYDAKNGGRNCVRIWDATMAQLLNANDIEIDRIKTLQRRVAGLSEKAEKMFMESIWGLVQALEAKDAYAKTHTENVMHYSVGIAQTMDLGPKHVDLIRRAAMIHDIGKIGIPDAILCKPDELTPHERAMVEQHPMIAVRILEKMSFLEREVMIVRHHHEKWNGQGYPDGLAKTAIPLGARIIGTADMFDALTATRAYHAARSVAEALGILTDSAGYELDPDVVAAAVTWFENIAQQCGKSLPELVLEDLLRWPRGPRPDRSCTELQTDATASPSTEPKHRPVMVALGCGDIDPDPESPDAPC